MSGRRQTSAETLPEEAIEFYREHGFVRIPGIISMEEAGYFRKAALALALAERVHSLHSGPIFTQLVNMWQEDEVMKQLTLHPNVAAIARRLAGVPLRLWHDQVLIKEPQRSAPTEFHQDQPFWPHADAPHALSAWVALVDVPVERGCMTFLPGSQRYIELAVQSVSKAAVFELAPELQWSPRVTVPLQAGDCTFHHARCVHGAGPNLTEERRVVHVVIFTDADTRYTGRNHVVTDPLRLVPGQRLEHPLFPPV